MLGRAEIMRPVDGSVLVQGWMHADTLQPLQAQLSGRVIHVLSPAPWPLEEGQITQPHAHSISGKFKNFLSKVLVNTDTPVGGVSGGSWQNKLPIEHLVAVPGEGIALPDSSQALIWSPLWLHHVNEPTQLMAQWHRVLKPEGGVFFSCFGPDTAKELQSFASALGQHLPDFSDMHDLGDALSRQGFSDPVMEMEKLTLTYADPRKMIAEWRQVNANLLLDRKPGLSGKSALAKAYANLANDLPAGADRYHLTLELVYGHAWKVKKNQSPQIATVSVRDIGGRKNK